MYAGTYTGKNWVAREIEQYKTGNFREGTYATDVCKWTTTLESNS